MAQPEGATPAPVPRDGDGTDDQRLRHEIARAWATLVDRADAIGDDIAFSVLERNHAWYEQATPEMRADVRTNTREHIRRGLRAMAGLPGAREQAIALWRETGRRRARQGVPMEFVLSAYTLGTRVLWESLLEQAREHDLEIEEHALVVAGQRIWTALDVQNAVLVEAYRRETARLQRRDLQRRNTFLDGLVEGRGADPEYAAEVRDVLDVGADDPITCLVAPFDGSLDEPLRSPEDRLERAGVVSHWHVRGGMYFGLLGHRTADQSELLALLEPMTVGRVGLSPSPDGMAGFATAYRLAARAAETLPPGAREIAAVTDRLPEVLLSGSPEVTGLLVQETLGPVLAQAGTQADTLLETLAALLAHDGSPTHAAEQLFCHRNTVIYRLKQIEQLTARSLSDPRDKLLLNLATMAVRGLPRPPDG